MASFHGKPSEIIHKISRLLKILSKSLIYQIIDYDFGYFVLSGYLEWCNSPRSYRCPPIEPGVIDPFFYFLIA